jgi:hypothetical protein
MLKNLLSHLPDHTLENLQITFGIRRRPDSPLWEPENSTLLSECTHRLIIATTSGQATRYGAHLSLVSERLSLFIPVEFESHPHHPLPRDVKLGISSRNRGREPKIEDTG